jgi:predicted RNase H-like HicB family nuclease
MASASRDGDENGVHFLHEDDGSVTAVDEETGLARGGDTKSQALAQLAEALTLHEGGGDPIDDPEAFLQAELDLESSEDDEERPELLE